MIIHAGPYVRCRVPQVEVRKTALVCPEKTCQCYHDTDRLWLGSKFCNHCGSKLVDLAYTKSVSGVGVQDLYQRMAERLSYLNSYEYHEWSRENKMHIWTPNIFYSGHLDSLAEGMFATVSVIWPDIPADIQLFRNTFASEIGILEIAYGAENVLIDWGIIHDKSEE